MLAKIQDYDVSLPYVSLAPCICVHVAKHAAKDATTHSAPVSGVPGLSSDPGGARTSSVYPRPPIIHASRHS